MVGGRLGPPRLFVSRPSNMYRDVRIAGRDPAKKFKRGAGHACVFWFGMGFALAGVVSARANEHPGRSDKKSASLSIPAQTLADALYTYSSVMGIEILVPGDLVAGRRSNAVSGTFTPTDALNALLKGTGLAPRYTQFGAFTLAPAEQSKARSQAWTPDYPDYSAALQQAVTQTLCRLDQHKSDPRRTLLRLWVAPSGAVTRVSVTGVSDDARPDARLAGLLGQLVIQPPPPVGLSQPSTLVVQPGRALGCGSIGAGVLP